MTMNWDMDKLKSRVSGWMFFLFWIFLLWGNISSIIWAPSLLNLSDAWIGLEEIVFHIPLLLGFWIALGGRFNLTSFSLAGILGFGLEKGRFFSHVFNGFLEVHHLYPAAFYHGGQHVNMQYGILTGYLLMGPFLIWRLFHMGKERIHGIFITTIIVVTLGATCLFHQLIVSYGLSSSLEFSRKDRMATMLALGERNTPDCLPNMECLSLAGPMPMKGHSSQLVFSINQAIYNHMGDRGSHVEDGYKPFHLTLPINGLASSLPGNQYVLYSQNGIHHVIIDTKDYIDIARHQKVQFGILVVVAHMWWLLGGVFLMWWHGRRRR